MAIKKSELYTHLWKSCDELRGGMDASQYKDYVLVLLFVKYVSDKYAGLEDADVRIPEEGSFDDIVALKNNPEIGDRINQIISKLAEENELKGIIDVADFNDENKLGKGKEMQDRLSNLVAIFEQPVLNFKNNQADGDDLLGDAYEYLMRNFATQSGKSKGQFYTPAEVSRVIAQTINIENAKSQDKTIYDPTCGSGSLLLKAVDQSEFGLTIYGQEMDNATRALAKMNMILHGHADAEIYQGNTLASPHWKNEQGNLKTFNFAVANPPFSAKSWMNGFNPNEDEFKRFETYEIPPAKNGDYAFLLHLLHSLNSQGKGAIILPHGVLFRGNAEANIRKKLIEKGVIKGIIGLPPNLFYGTGIPACIIILDKENADTRRSIFMIDGSRGFQKDGNKNRLREQDIRKIVDVFNQELIIPKYSRLVPITEIAKNDYNLNLPRYIDTQEVEDIQDIKAHLQGGIPKADVEALANYWEIYPSLKQELFQPLESGYLQIKVSPDEVKKYIFEHPEFTNYANALAEIFNQWWDKNLSNLKGIKQGDNPKAVIRPLAESLLRAFENRNLIDKYDIYQHLMNYWLETMRDDVYILVQDGWVAEITPVTNNNNKVIDYTCELIPKALMINRYFSEDKANIESLETQKEEITRQQEEMEEENSGEDGLFAEVMSDAGKVTKTNINARIKEIKNDPDFADELAVIKNYLALIEQSTKLDKQIKEAQKRLNEQVIKQYQKLTPEEIKTLVVDEKWIPRLWESLRSEMEQISQRLAQRIQDLAERYNEPLPQLEEQAEALSKKVEDHIHLIMEA